jgi:hypothetical protein
MPGPDQARHQLFLAVFAVSGFRIVDQQDSHDWFPTVVHNLFGQKQAGTRS